MEKKVYIAGGMYGCHNIGDEAILLSTIRSFSPFYDLVVSTSDNQWITNQFSDVQTRKKDITFARAILGLNTTPRKNSLTDLPKVWSEKRFIQSIDGFICGGGTVLSDCPWHAMTFVNLACQKRKPVIAWGPGIAENNNERERRYIKKTLNNAYVKKIFLRDECVKKRVMDIGVDERKLDVCYDPAIVLEGQPFELSYYFASQQIDKIMQNKINIALCLSGENDVLKKTPMAVFITYIKTIIEQIDCNIFFIASGHGSHCKDLDVIGYLEKEINSERIIAIKKEFTPQHMIEFLKNIDLVVSSRLHVNIFSACGGNTQFIGLVRNLKIIDFSNIMKQPYFLLESLDSQQLVNETLSLLKNKNKNLKFINQQVNYMRKVHRSAVTNAIKDFNL